MDDDEAIFGRRPTPWRVGANLAERQRFIVPKEPDWMRGIAGKQVHLTCAEVVLGPRPKPKKIGARRRRPTTQEKLDLILRWQGVPRPEAGASRETWVDYYRDLAVAARRAGKENIAADYTRMAVMLMTGDPLPR